ncbi:hypothetical protein ACOBV8_18615 (plasmid) [Pseudoalteromonas espejiana]
MASVVEELNSTFLNVTLEFLSASSLGNIIDLLKQETPLTGIIF